VEHVIGERENSSHVLRQLHLMITNADAAGDGKLPMRAL